MRQRATQAVCCSPLVSTDAPTGANPRQRAHNVFPMGAGCARWLHARALENKGLQSSCSPLAHFAPVGYTRGDTSIFAAFSLQSTMKLFFTKK